MRKNQKSESQKERDKKGAERIKRFEEGQIVEKPPIIKPMDDNNSEYEDYVVVSYQKKEPGDWEKVEITYQRKKKGR